MQRESNHSGGGTAGKPPQDPPSPHTLQSLENILDLVLSLSDEQWTTLTADVPVAVTKVQFASLCTNILASVTRSVVQRYLRSLTPVVGMEAVSRAEEKLDPSSSTTAEATSDQRSPVDPCDLLCHSIEDFIGKVKVAMQKAVCRVASCTESFHSKDLKTTCSRVTKEMFEILKKDQDTPGSDVVDLPDQIIRVLPAQIQVDTDSCTDGIIHNIVDLYKKEVQSGSFEAIQSASVCSSDRSEPTLPSDEFLSKAIQVVNDILTKKASQQISPASSQEEAGTEAGLSSTSVPSCEDVHSTAVDITGTVVGTLDKLVDSNVIDGKSDSDTIIKSLGEFRFGPCGSKTRRSRPAPLFKRIRQYLQALFTTLCEEQTVGSTPAALNKTSTDVRPEKEEEQDSVNTTSIKPPPQQIPRFQVNIDSCMDEVIVRIVELYKSELLLLSSSEVPPHSSTSLPEQSSFNLKTAKSKDFLTEAVKLVTNVLVKEVPSSASSSSAPSAPSAPSATSTDLQAAAVTIAETAVDAVDKYVESSNSSWETLSCLDVLSQTSVSSIPATSERMAHSSPYFVFRRVKDLLNRLFMGVGRRMMDDGEMPGTSGGSGGQNGLSGESSGSDRTFTEGQFVQVFTESQSKAEILLLLLDSEHTLSERSCDMMSLDSKTSGVSPKTSSKAGSSSEDYETNTSSSSRGNNNCSVDPGPPTVKKKGLGFRFIVGKRPPVIRVGVRKFNKVHPDGVVSDNQQPALSSGHLQDSSQTESQGSGSPFKTTRERLSRIVSAMRRALPNPFKCMTCPQ